MTTIGLIRHGVTDWNREGRMQGQNDIPLNDEGRQQAERLGCRLAEEAWDLIYTSSLSRAKETAAIVSRCTNLKVVTEDPRLAERAFGAMEGTTEQERVERWGPAWRQQELGAESKMTVVDRTLAVLEDIHKAHPGRRILVVSHGAVIGSLLETLYPDIGYTGLRNTCVNVLHRIREGEWELRLHNCTKHLEEEGL